MHVGADPDGYQHRGRKATEASVIEFLLQKITLELQNIEINISARERTQLWTYMRAFSYRHFDVKQRKNVTITKRGTLSSLKVGKRQVLRGSYI